MSGTVRAARLDESAATRILVIRAGGGRLLPDLRELWRYRELLMFLTWREISIRYKQAFLGLTWALIQPVVTLVVFTVIFGGLVRVPTGGIPYPVFGVVGLLPWQLFTNSVQRGSTSLVGNAGMLTKVYFPRLAMPVSSVLSSLVDFVVAGGVLAALFIYYRVPVSPRFLLVVPFSLLAIASSAMAAIWLSAANVLYRDVQYVVPFILQIFLYVSPVAYDVSSVPAGAARAAYALNPMVGVIQGFRSALLGTPLDTSSVLLSVVVTVVGLVLGLMFFRRVERVFADVV